MGEDEIAALSVTRIVGVARGAADGERQTWRVGHGHILIESHREADVLVDGVGVIAGLHTRHIRLGVDGDIDGERVATAICVAYIDGKGIRAVGVGIRRIRGAGGSGTGCRSGSCAADT